MSLLIVNTIQPQTGSIVNISGSLTISQSLIVADDITLSGKLTLGNANTDSILVNSEFTSSLIPDIDGAFDLGTGVKKWGTVFAKSGSFDNISGSINLTDGLVSITSASISYLSGSSPITVAGEMIPDVTNTHNLGTAAKKFNDLFINDISASGDITSSGTGLFIGGIDAVNATGSFGYISASGDISTSGTGFFYDLTVGSITASNMVSASGGVTTTAVFADSAVIPIIALSTSLINTGATQFTGPLTASGTITASNMIIGQISASRVSASAGFEADTLSTSSFGYISASGGISTSGEVYGVSGSFTTLTGTLTTAAQPNITSLGTLTSLTAEFANVSGYISSSTFQGNNIIIYGANGNISSSGNINAVNITASNNIIVGGMISASSILYGTSAIFASNGNTTTTINSLGQISASRVSASAGFEADTLSTSSFGYISASGNVSTSGNILANSFVTNKEKSTSTDALFYSVNGFKVEVRNQVQATLSDGAFSFFELRNTSISTDSIVLGSFTGNTAGAITGSMITAATIGFYTASIQIHNESGEAVADDTPYTASFIVL